MLTSQSNSTAIASPNPYNEDLPSTEEQFAAEYNSEASLYLANLEVSLSVLKLHATDA